MDSNKPSKENLLRLNKFLAKWGGVSRRKAEELIKQGNVFINGKKILHLSIFVDPKKDLVRLKKRKIHAREEKSLSLMFNKPQRVLTTNQDPMGRPTVMDYFKNEKDRLFPVGRLDWDSEGLLILTNDGDLADKILHPKYKIPKTYLVKLRGCPKDSDFKKLIRGVSTPLGKKKALFARAISSKSSTSLWVKIILCEGKKRQIRLMFERIGFPVHRLKRTAIGRLKMNKLPKGAFMKLREKDLKKIFQWPKEIKAPLSKRRA